MFPYLVGLPRTEWPPCADGSTSVQTYVYVALSKGEHMETSPGGRLIGAVYISIACLVGLLTFVSGWWYAVITWGWFLGLGLGWIPAVFVALITGFIWPLIAVGIVLLFVGASMQDNELGHDLTRYLVAPVGGLLFAGALVFMAGEVWRDRLRQRAIGLIQMPGALVRRVIAVGVMLLLVYASMQDNQLGHNLLRYLVAPILGLLFAGALILMAVEVWRDKLKEPAIRLVQMPGLSLAQRRRWRGVAATAVMPTVKSDDQANRAED